jgi:hypothetical protein
MLRVKDAEDRAALA